MKTIFKHFMVVNAVFMLHTSTQSQTLLDKSQWNLFLDQKFDNISNISQLSPNWDFTPRWGVPGWNDPVLVGVRYTTDNLILKDGLLNITVKNQSGTWNQVNPDGSTTPQPYTCTSGCLFSKFKYGEPTCTGNTNGEGYLYGMFEMRCKLPKAIGNALLQPNFWLPNVTAEPREIDIFEIPPMPSGESDLRFMSTVHWCDWPNFCNDNHPSVTTIYKKVSPGKLWEDFHTWTLVLTPTEISWFFDGKEIRTDKARPSALGCGGNCPEAGGICPTFENFYDCSWKRFEMMVANGTTVTNGNWGTDDTMKIQSIRVYRPKSLSNWNYKQYISSGVAYSPDNNNITLPGSSSNVAQSKISINGAPGNIFYRGTDFRLWNYYWTGTTWATAPLSWSVTDVMEDVTYFAGTNRVYYRSTSNKLKYFEWNGSTWTNNSTTGFSDCAGFLFASNNNQVYYKSTPDNNIWSAFIWNGSWIKTQITTTGNISGGLIGGVNNPVLYYKGTDNNIWRLYWNGSWSQPQICTSDHNATNYTAYDETNDKLYYIGINGRIYQCTLSSYSALSSSAFDNNAVGELGISPDKKILYYKGTDNRIWYYFQDNGNLSGGINGGGGLKWYKTCLNWNLQDMATGGPITTRSDGYIYYRNSSNSIVELKWDASEIINPPADCWWNAYTPDNVYKTDETTIIEDVITPLGGALKVYPNPSTNDFIFDLNVTSLSVVSINIYDISGNLIKVIAANETREIGNHQFTFTTESLSSGVYFYNLEFGNTKYRGKLVKL